MNTRSVVQFGPAAPAADNSVAVTDSSMGAFGPSSPMTPLPRPWWLPEMHDARHSDAVYQSAEQALSHDFRDLPLLTIFGERNDPFAFQARWKRLFSDALQVVVANGHHFPMCDDPELVATTI